MQEYKSDKLVVRYDPEICIHAGNCVRELPAVFDVAKEPWITIHGAPVDEIVNQVKHCPSGALSYEILDKTSKSPDVHP